MKRTVMSILGALAVAAGFNMLATQAAHAALPGAGTHNGVTCVAYADTSGQYPGNSHFYDCQSNVQRRNAVFGVPRGTTPHTNNDLNTGNVTYYFFNSFADYSNYFSGAGYPVAPLAGIAEPNGFSYDGLNGTAFPYSVIFSNVGGVMRTTGALRGTAAHETGHQLDYLWRNYPTTPAGSVSRSSKYQQLLERDLWLLNYNFVGGSGYSVRPPCGSGGALVNLVRPDGAHVCDGNHIIEDAFGNPIYTGTNSQILATIYPIYFNYGTWTSFIAATSTPTVGSVVKYDFYNSALPSGHVSVSYTVVSGDTPASIASALAGLITSNVPGVSAAIDPGNNQTINISVPTTGHLYQITSTVTGSAVLASYIRPYGLNEFFSEQFVHVSGNRVSTSDDVAYASIEAMIQSQFGCSNGMVAGLNSMGAEPGSPPGAGYSFNCTRPLPPGAPAF